MKVWLTCLVLFLAACHTAHAPGGRQHSVLWERSKQTRQMLDGGTVTAEREGPVDIPVNVMTLALNLLSGGVYLYTGSPWSMVLSPGPTTAVVKTAEIFARPAARNLEIPAMVADKFTSGTKGQ